MANNRPAVFAFVLALVAATFVVVGIPTAAEASFPGEPGLLAYVVHLEVGDGDQYREIYTMNPDATDRRRITFDGGTHVTTTTLGDEVGAAEVNVYTESWSPAWSPDGLTLAFLHRTASGSIELRLANPDGSNGRVLSADFPGGSIAWSPDGRHIAYTTTDGLYRSPLDLNAPTLLATPEVFPPGWPYKPQGLGDVTWSPDGRHIAYIDLIGGTVVSGQTHVNVVDVDGSNLRTGLCGTSGSNHAIDWMPDGSALVCDRRLGFSSIWIVQPDGSPPGGIAGGPTNKDYPVVSPNGTALLYQNGYETALWSYDFATTSNTLIDDGFLSSDLDWQPVQPSGPAAVTLLGGTATVSAAVAAETMQLVGEVPARWFGSDRFETAAAISAANFSPGVPVVYVATGLDYPDALAAAAPAAAGAGPVLLVRPGSIPPAIHDELERLTPRQIVVVGGSAAVSDAVLTQLQQYTSGSVSRLAGANRDETAVEVSKAGFPTGADMVLLATGVNYPDAVAGAAAAGTIGAPILLSAPDAVPGPVVAELLRLDPDQVVLLGGPTALNESVATQLEALGFTDVIRIAGSNRYATSVAISQWVFPTGADQVVLATGENFPDALTGAAVAGRAGIPVLLVQPADIPATVAVELTRLL